MQSFRLLYKQVKLPFLFLVLISSFLILPRISLAFTCTATAGGGNWNSAATWSGCNSTFPQSGDDVVLNSASGNVAVNTNTTSLKSLTMTGYLGTLSGTSNITVTGSTGTTQNVIFDGTITWTGILALNPGSATSNLNLTTNGKLLTTVSMAGSAATVTLQDNLSFTAAKSDTFTIASSLLNMNGKTISGNSAINRVLILSSALGTQRTITIGGGTFANADFKDINLSASTDLSAITGNSGDCGGNSNITFTASTTQTSTGTASFSWSTHGWTSRVPLCQDNVIINNAFVSGRTITVDMPRLGHNIDLSGATWSGTAPTWQLPIGITIFGSLSFAPGFILGDTASTHTFETRGASTLNQNGASVPGRHAYTFAMFGGSMTLQSALNTGTGSLVVSNGTFDASNFNVTANTNNSSGSGVRAITMGSGTWTLIGTGANTWNTSGSNMTLTTTGSTIILSNTSTTGKTFTGNGSTYNNVSFTGDNITVTGSNTISGTLFVGKNATSSGIILTAGTTQTIGNLTTDSDSSNRAVLKSATASSNATLSKSSGTVCVDYMNITDIVGTGGATWNMGTNSTLTRTTGLNSTSCTVSPSISSFSALPTSVIPNASSTLSWSVSGSPTPTLSINSGVGDVSGLTHIPVAPSTSTTYTLTAVNSGGTTTAMATITVVPSAVISNVSVSGISTSTATITWTTDIAASTQVQYGLSSSYTSSTTLNMTPATSHSATITGLSASTTYHYSASSTNSAGTVSTSSDATFTTLADTTAPSSPSGLSANAVSSSRVNLSWTASTDNVGVTGYNIYRNNVLIASSTNTNYGSTGLDASTLYSFQVSAYDAFLNESSLSSASEATTLGPGEVVTTAYLRSSGPAGVTITGVTNATPVVIQTNTAHNLSDGDFVTIFGVCGTTAANGTRKVKAVVDSTHFSITDLDDVDIVGNGAWCSGAGPGYGAGAQAVGKVNPFILSDHPRVIFDGSDGSLTREISLGTHNGLTSIVASNNVVTVTTSYSHGVEVGDKVGIWGTTSSTLNGSGAARTITARTDTTFSFPLSIADGDYTTNNACGPSSTGNCVRVSQRAWTGNPWWDALSSRATPGWGTGIPYKHVYDGGIQTGASSLPSLWAAAGMRLFVDQTNTQMRAAVIYGLTHIERIGGVNFTLNETQVHGGNNSLNDYASWALWGIANLWETGKDYLTPTEQQTFLDKIYNDLDDPSLTACTKTNIPLNNEGKLLASSTAQSGSSNTITLSASDSAADNYYVNNVVMTTIGTTKRYGLITAYNATTKVATISSTWTSNPVNGTNYKIFATITRSGSTITGYNTTFTTDLEVGDAVIGSNAWDADSPGSGQSYVSAINSDTSLTVINASSVDANSTPSILWQIKQWKPGSCGLVWMQKHWSPAMSAQPIYYPPSGGSGTTMANTARDPGWGANYRATYSRGNIAADLAMADSDPRALRNLSIIQTTFFDYILRFFMQYFTGFSNSGSYYGFGRPIVDIPHAVQAIRNSVIDYPSMDESGPWVTNIALIKIFDTLPDLKTTGGSNSIWPARFGAQTGDNRASPGGLTGSSFIIDGGFLFASSSVTSEYLKQFLTDKGLWTSSGVLSSDAVDSFVAISPKQQVADYTAQPEQYLFQNTSQSACDSLTGWSCTGTLRGDAMISRTGWSSATDTHVLFQARTFANDHDIPSGGSLRVYKAGHLLNVDTNPHGAGGEDTDTTKIDNLLEFGGAKNFKTSTVNLAPPTSNITRWASANHGSWDSAYGDADSRYAYALANVAGQYSVSLTRAVRHIIHFKKPGTEEIIVQFDDAVPATPMSIRSQVHYAQNGEASNDWMAEGQTTCPGTSGCAGLDSDRLILSQESGTREYASNPLRTFGVISRFFSPGTIFVRDDGSNYTGTAGHTHRVSICGGSSCGAPVSSLEAIIVHKIASSLSDTTLTATSTNPDANWTGVQTADKVAMFSRGGVTRSSLNFTTDHSGTAQYLIAGLSAGSYDVQKDGQIIVSNQTVADGDNTLYFEAGSGSYVIDATGLTDVTPPNISSISATSTVANTATITWTTDEPATGQVEYGTSQNYSASSTLESSLTTSHTITLLGLNASTTYHFRVVSVDNSGNSGTSSDQTVLTSATVDSDDPVISEIGYSAATSSATIVWTTDEPANSQVEYGATSSYTSSSTIDFATSTTHSIILSGLSASTTYHYRVRSVDSASNLGLSDDQTLDTLSDPDTEDPSVPADLTASAVSATEVSLSWTNSIDNVGVVGYRIYRDAQEIASVDTNFFLDFHLDPETLYSYTVSAFDALNNSSDPSAAADATTFVAPPEEEPAAESEDSSPTPEIFSSKSGGNRRASSGGLMSGNQNANQSVSIFTNSLKTASFVPLQSLKSVVLPGSKGPAVLSLQQFLNNFGFQVAQSGPGSLGMETDYFGPLTRSALIRFQEFYRNEILIPLGLEHGTGILGVYTRAKIQSLINPTISLEIRKILNVLNYKSTFRING